MSLIRTVLHTVSSVPVNIPLDCLLFKFKFCSDIRTLTGDIAAAPMQFFTYLTDGFIL